MLFSTMPILCEESKRRARFLGGEFRAPMLKKRGPFTPQKPENRQSTGLLGSRLLSETTNGKFLAHSQQGVINSGVRAPFSFHMTLTDSSLALNITTMAEWGLFSTRQENIALKTEGISRAMARGKSKIGKKIWSLCYKICPTKYAKM